MKYNLDEFLENSISQNEAEKKNMIIEMIDILDSKQLSEVISILREPYFTYKLKDYLRDSRMPDFDSPEFLFLIQAAKYNGNIARKLMRKAKISKYYLDKFINNYELIEIATGMYVFPHKDVDAQFLFQLQYTKAVISHESALYMLNLSDVIPKQTIISMPKDYNFPQIKSNSSEYIKIEDGIYNNNKSLVLNYYQNDPLLLTKNNPIVSNQIVTKKTIYKNPVKVTSAERTIADVFKQNANTEEEVKYEALKNYYNLYSKKDTRLRRVAKEQNVLKEVDKYLWFLQLFKG